MKAIKKSKGNEPFTDGEKRIIKEHGKEANALIQKIWNFTDEQMKGYAWYLTHYQGRLIIAKNLNYENKGVKIAQLVLGEDGQKTFKEWLARFGRWGKMPIAKECLKCSDCGGHIVRCEICLEPIKKGDLIECSDKIETKDCRHAHKQCFDDEYQITKSRNKKEVKNEEDPIS